MLTHGTSILSTPVSRLHQPQQSFECRLCVLIGIEDCACQLRCRPRAGRTIVIVPASSSKNLINTEPRANLSRAFLKITADLAPSKFPEFLGNHFVVLGKCRTEACQLFAGISNFVERNLRLVGFSANDLEGCVVDAKELPEKTSVLLG
ncbi:MAG: hypothetical protein ACPHCI_05125 [Solirubrobacterales bacterium]